MLPRTIAQHAKSVDKPMSWSHLLRGLCDSRKYTRRNVVLNVTADRRDRSEHMALARETPLECQGPSTAIRTPANASQPSWRHRYFLIFRRDLSITLR